MKIKSLLNSRIVRFSIYTLILQTQLLTLINAADLNGQGIQSVRNVIVDLSVKSTTLSNVFSTIESKTDFVFNVNWKDIDQDRYVTLPRGGNTTVADILIHLSRNANLGFKQVNNNINVLKLEPSSQALEIDIQQQVIKGKVLDETNEPLPGVTILVKGTTRGTTTNIDGTYSIEASSGDVLVFGFIGYKSQEIAVGNQTTVDVSLAVDVESLDEVVVVGYGSQNRKELTSSISSISAKEIKEMPVVGVDQQIQGRAAGVVVVNNTGEPGGGITMRIRGTSSIGSGSEPLFVVDGMPIENTQTFNRNVGNAGVNGLSQINPADIESIEILKDAAATAIYGARASNGVVLITTKRGAEGTSEFSLDAYTGLSEVRSRYDLLGASDYATLVNEGMAQIGEPAPFSQAFIDNPTVDTDWQDEIFRTAKVNSINLSARGGNKTTGYMISGGYLSQEGTIEDSKFERYSLRTNVDHRVNDFIKIGTNIFGSFVNQDRVRNDGGPVAGDASHFSHIYGPPALSSALVYSPVYDVFDDMDYYSLDTVNQAFVNPVRQAKAIDIVNQATRLMPSVFTNIGITKNLLYTARFSTDIRSENEEWWNPPSPNVAVGINGSGQTSRRTYDRIMWTLDNYLTYDFSLGNAGDLSVLAGNSLQKATTETSFVLAAKIGSDFIKTLNAGVDYDIVTSERYAWSLASFFGRINYDYKDKYLLNLNARYDGSSRFGSDNRFGFFPSAAVGWRISQEGFMQSVSQVSELKLRASYGKTGNQAIGNYASRAILNLGTGTNSGNNYTDNTGATFSSWSSPNLTWEETAQLDIGLDATLFKDRVGVTLDYYEKTTTKLLFNVPIPTITGFSTIPSNLGEMKNTGWEASINTVNMRNNGFEWSTSFNIATNKNEIVSLPDGEDILVGNNSTGYSIARVGEPISFYNYKREKYVNPEDGKVVLIDQDGSETITTKDLVISGSPFPDFFGGVTNTFKYGGFDLSLFFQFTYGNEIYNVTRRTLETMSVSSKNVYSSNTTQKAFDNRWQNPGDQTEYPRLNYDQENNDFNLSHDGWLEDGSYLRLKTLTLGYNLDRGMLERLNMSRARVYVSANNLLTFTNYSGFDPEVDHYQGTGNGLLKGYDYGDYPQAKTYVVGLNLTF